MESSPPSSNLTDNETKNLIINVLRKWKFVPYIPQDELSAILIPWIVESSSKPDLILAVINELWESYRNDMVGERVFYATSLIQCLLALPR